MRHPDSLMTLPRLGASFPTRLAFMPSLLRRAAREQWCFEPPEVHLDDKGVGHVLLAVDTGAHVYTLIAYAHDLPPDQRSDRVIATAWDATFALFDGRPTDADIGRLAGNVPKQEAGRCQQSELVLSRANRSVRMFDHVIERLSQGLQPDPAMIRKVGYLMRTTAVYGNGKFGIADRAVIADRPEFRSSFMVEMLTVYLIRAFSFVLVEHLAAARNPARAVTLSDASKRALGIGNSTGLGMAPFLVSHPQLVDRWFSAREQALDAALNQEDCDADSLADFRQLLAQAQRHVALWQVDDARYTARIRQLSAELQALEARCYPEQTTSWHDLLTWSQTQSLDCQELLVALIIEQHADCVDDLADSYHCSTHKPHLDRSMPLAALRQILAQSYRWASGWDFNQPDTQARFWYVSSEKLEPRFGWRFEEPGADKETPLAIARDIQGLVQALEDTDAETVGQLVAQNPHLHAIIARVQATHTLAYAEIRDNLIGENCLPIDLLRAKLAMFGASRFDPKSDLWTRITMYQGAPLPHELDAHASKPWYFSDLAWLEEGQAMLSDTTLR